MTDNERSLAERFPGVEFIELTGPVKVFPNVTIGEGCTVYGPSVLGHPPRGVEPGELALEIGAESVIRAFSIIYAGTSIGEGFQTGHYTVVREKNVIGDNCSVGTGAALEYGNHLGNRVSVHTHAGMENATLADGVFIGPGARLADDPHAPCPRSPDCVGGVKVGAYGVIGADATVLAGVTVGARAVVAAKAVATRDVPDRAVVAGNPARYMKDADDIPCHEGFYPHAYAWSKPE